MDSFLIINGVAVTAPILFKPDIEDVDGNSYRNAKGKTFRDRVAVKRKLNCEWGPLSMAECSTLLKAVKDEFFQVKYPDPEEGAFITKTFYVGPRSAPALVMDKNGEITWKGLTMNFIEQ